MHFLGRFINESQIKKLMNWTLIHKYLSDQAGKAEQKKVEEWIQENPEHKAFMGSIENIWNVTPKEEAGVDIEEAWHKFHSQRMKSSKLLYLKNKKERPGFKNYSHKTKIKWYQRKATYVAAAVFALLVVVFFAVKHQLDQQNQSLPVTYQKIITQAGEKTQIILADGSRVKLNAGSSLKIPSNFGQKTRTVYLTGEAFFSVEHKEAHPFIVQAKELFNEDIGTNFNIKAYSENPGTEVVVAEGEVKLDAASRKEEEATHLV